MNRCECCCTCIPCGNYHLTGTASVQQFSFVLQLQVRIAEFQSESVQCTVSGSGFPGLARQHQLAGLTAGQPLAPVDAPLWGKAETGRLPKGTIATGKGGSGASSHWVHSPVCLCQPVTKTPGAMLLYRTEALLLLRPPIIATCYPRVWLCVHHGTQLLLCYIDCMSAVIACHALVHLCTKQA